MKRYGLLGVFAALVLTACGNGSVKSPDFESELLSIAVTPRSASVGAGESQQFIAKGTFSSQPGVASVTRDITNEVTWTSSSPTVASIGESTGLAVGGTVVGTTTITASRDGEKATATLTSEGRVLRSITITPAQAATQPGGSVTYKAQGLYSDSPTTPVSIEGLIINWTIDNATLGVLSSPVGETVKVTAPADSLGGQTYVHARVTVNGQPLTGDALFGVGILTSLRIEPATDSKPVGLPSKLLTAMGLYTPPSGAPFEMATDATWTATDAAAPVDKTPVLDDQCDGKASSTCKVTGRTVGTVTVKAVSTGTAPQTATAAITVTDPVLVRVEITPDPSTTNPRATPLTFDLPQGATQTFYALYYYSDDAGKPVTGPRTDADLVAWTSSAPSSLSIEPGLDNAIKATGETPQTSSNLVATAGAIKDSLKVNVGPAEIQSLLGVRPAKAYVGVGRQQEFTAYGVYSTGETRDVADGKVTWSSSDQNIAKIDAMTGVATAQTTPNSDGAQITATLKTNPTEKASATMIVTPEACATPLTSTDGATAERGPEVGVCVLCNTANPDNVVDPDPSKYGTLVVGVGALDASRSIDVTAADSAPYTVPFAAGSRPAFVIANATGPLVLAEVLSQIQISTLLDGAVQESSSNPATPLRLDLLGAELINAGKTQGLVSFLTSKPYDGIRIQLKSGLATALSTVQVSQACGTSLLPVQPASGLSSLEAPGVAADAEPTVEVGASLALVAHDKADPTQSLNGDDVEWTSSDKTIADVNPNGVVTGVAPGEAMITGTLKDKSICGSNCSVTRTVKVIPAVCEIPLQMSAGATIDSQLGGLCLGCTATDLKNAIDADPQTFGSVYVPVGLLGAGISVTANVQPPLKPVQPGNTAGFVLASENGTLLTAGIGDQIVIRTLKDGKTVDASNRPLTPLRLDLLGVSVTGALGANAQPLFIQTTKEFDALQVSFSGGLLTALSGYRVYAACAKGPANAP